MTSPTAPNTQGASKSSGFGMWLTRTLGSLPYLVSGIEQIHGDVSGGQKKQIAMDALGLAVQVAGSVDPALDPALAAATALISQTIDGVKAVYNAIYKKGSAAASSQSSAMQTPVPIASAAPVATPNS